MFTMTPLAQNFLYFHQVYCIKMMRLVVDSHQNDVIVHQNDEEAMRTTLTIPDPFYQRVKESLPERGYTSINSYLLDLLRHQIDANGGKRQTPVNNSHQNDATPGMKVAFKDKTVAAKAPADDKVEQAKLRAKTQERNLNVCKHGYIAKLCKHEECRKNVD